MKEKIFHVQNSAPIIHTSKLELSITNSVSTIRFSIESVLMFDFKEDYVKIVFKKECLVLVFTDPKVTVQDFQQALVNISTLGDPYIVINDKFSSGC